MAAHHSPPAPRAGAPPSPAGRAGQSRDSISCCVALVTSPTRCVFLVGWAFVLTFLLPTCWRRDREACVPLSGGLPGLLRAPAARVPGTVARMEFHSGGRVSVSLGEATRTSTAAPVLLSGGHQQYLPRSQKTKQHKTKSGSRTWPPLSGDERPTADPHLAPAFWPHSNAAQARPDLSTPSVHTGDACPRDDLGVSAPKSRGGRVRISTGRDTWWQGHGTPRAPQLLRGHPAWRQCRLGRKGRLSRELWVSPC